MSVRFEFFPEIDLVYIAFEGVLKVDEMLSVIDLLDNDPRYHPTISELGDFRRLTGVEMQPGEVENITQLILGLYVRAGRRKRIAQIAPQPPGSMIAEIFAQHVRRQSGLQVATFDTVAPALRFLRLLPGPELLRVVSS